VSAPNFLSDDVVALIAAAGIVFAVLMTALVVAVVRGAARR
jgi:hypothetical protein